jgi:hypothetical protein
MVDVIVQQKTCPKYLVKTIVEIDIDNKKI